MGLCYYPLITRAFYISSTRMLKLVPLKWGITGFTTVIYSKGDFTFTTAPVYHAYQVSGVQARVAHLHLTNAYRALSDIIYTPPC